MSAPPWAAYRFVRDVVPPGDGDDVHLHNLAITALLFEARNSYITEQVGMTWESLAETGRSFIMRRLELDFEQEVPAGIALKVGVRAATRSRRTVTFEETVWRGDPPVAVAVARSVHLVVRLDAPGAIELPPDLVELIERYEGHPLSPPAGLSSG